MATKSMQAIVKQGESASKALSRYRARAREEQSQLVTKAEVLVGATAAGALDGMYAENDAEVFELGGLPANALIGGGAVLAAIVAGRQLPGYEHVAALGLGLLCGFGYSEGRSRAKG